MRRFVITAYPANEGDPFHMQEPERSYSVHVTGLKNLQKMIHCKIFPKCKKHSARWYGKKVNKYRTFYAKHQFFNTSLFDIREVSRTADNRHLKSGAIILELPLKEPA